MTYFDKKKKQNDIDMHNIRFIICIVTYRFADIEFEYGFVPNDCN